MSDPEFGSPIMSGRTPAEDDALLTLPRPPGSLPSEDVTVSGRPLLYVKIPESSQPPRAYLKGPLAFPKNGRGYTYDPVTTCRRSSVARPYSACQLYVF